MRHLTPMFEPHVGHIASDVGWSTSSLVIAGLIAIFVAVLIVEHHVVKHGRRAWRQLRTPVAAIVAIALGAVVAPTPGFAQSSIGPMGLPDLVSDPAFIWVEQVREHPVDGQIMRTLAFDGILHNIGTGALDLSGNPQVEGGVKQRVFDGEKWEDVGEPLVRYETDDGHNHFHLMNAAAYSLWNEAQTEMVDIGDKVGFCLLDTQQVERGVEAAYLLDEINYCNVDEPDSTDLRMGISPGWVDIYEASLTFQWIDTSNTLPGRYWVGSAIDPNNEIVESNEDNNDVVFSSNKYAVSGHNARQLPVQAPGAIELKSVAYGTVGQRAFVIAEPPEHGTLSVPVGHDLLSGAIEYLPEPGFEGTDSFSYYAHDVDSAFPFDPLIVSVDVVVSGERTDSNTGDASTGSDLTDDSVSIDDPGAQDSARYDRVVLDLRVDGTNDDDDVQWFAQGLPTGLSIDPSSGQVAGEITMPGDMTSTITAMVNGAQRSIDVDWSVVDAPRSSLRPINDFSTIMGRRDIVLGAGTAETTYRAQGLPEGVLLVEGQPSILGTPTEAGDFDVTVEELLDGEVVDSVSFTMTVRPAAKPEFVL